MNGRNIARGLVIAGYLTMSGVAVSADSNNAPKPGRYEKGAEYCDVFKRDVPSPDIPDVVCNTRDMNADFGTTSSNEGKMLGFEWKRYFFMVLPDELQREVVKYFDSNNHAVYVTPASREAKKA
ncbi:MAG: hypothetical protein HY517_04490, partial [Candidatus Aenigmarchaeota archaeon]|nr:hypothetical protein [Candidatus Aenigmarchaeota archaeon]